MDLILQDLRQAARSLARNRGYVAVTVLSLALGIGVNAAIFTIGNGLLLKPMPAAHPERLVRVYYGDHSAFSYADFTDLHDQSASALSLAASQPAMVAVGRGDAARMAGAEVVTGDFFATLGITPAAGRFFSAAEGSASSGEMVAVIGDALARREFGGPDAAVNRPVTVNGLTYAVIGVAAPEFHGSHVVLPMEVWLPISAGPRILGMSLTRRSVGGGLYTFGRLKDGATTGEARAALNLAAARITAAFPDIHRNYLTVNVGHARGVPAEQWGALAVMATGALVMAGLVLLIACSNVVNVALARAASRRREVAVRAALGAGKWRLVRQMASESVIVAGAAAVAGLLAASWVAHAVLQVMPADSPFAQLDLAPDVRVFGFTALATVLVVFACGILPALRSARVPLLDSIREGAPTADRRGMRFRAALVGAQVALCTLLLVGSGLFVRSLANAGAIDTGFNPRGVLNVPLDARMLSLDSARGREFYRAVMRRVSAIPGVEVATLANLVPLSFDNNGMSFSIEGRETPPGTEPPEARFNIVAPGYFATLGIPLLRGRDFTAADGDRAPFVAIINETMARRYWPGEDAVGKQFGRNAWGTPATVIGVAKDSKYTTLGEGATPFMYLAFDQHYSTRMVLQLRARGDAAALVPAVRAELRAEGPALPLASMRPLADEVKVAILPARIGASVLGAFGLLALVLALGGVYGVAAYTVAQRTREIGIRAALGGTATAIIAFILRGSLRSVAAGIGAGLLLALGAGRAMTSFLYGVGGSDPVTFALVPALLAAAAALACIIPARRAARVEPIVALRME